MEIVLTNLSHHYILTKFVLLESCQVVGLNQGSHFLSPSRIGMYTKYPMAMTGQRMGPGWAREEENK
jgi:hypothetical protein